MTEFVNTASTMWLNNVAKEKTELLHKLFTMEPLQVDDVMDRNTGTARPRTQGEDIVQLWEDELYDATVQGIVVDTVTGPSTPHRDYVNDEIGTNDKHKGRSTTNSSANPAMPYQQLRSLVGDGGRWKWPEIWKQLDLLPRRGRAYRHVDDPSNLHGQIANPNPDIVPLNCLVVGGGPVGLRLAIELVLGGHRATVWEKRREVRDTGNGKIVSLGFTNRVNRPHINNFCRNDLDRLNGRNFMTGQMCYPVFTNTHTSSIGIDELQMLLLKTALLVGVRFRLGVGYETAVVDIVDRTVTQRPTWLVTYDADDIACAKYGLPGTKGQQRFDALFGCDGGNSKVRQTQVQWLGEPQTRVYKKMFGIVANIRKCSRSKLREMGYKSGLEPEDRAGLQTGVYFYKASYHNYLIVHPSKQEMELEGIPWKAIYTFDKARDPLNKEEERKADEQAQVKTKLKQYMTKKAGALGIPIDTSARNDGFVEPPNDVMGFDFSQFYNCEKSAAVYVPPLDWNAQQHGDWEVHCPLVALAGDSVTDPNWLLGVGLQRGWNSAMDACFYADNLYNNTTFNGKPPCLKEPITSPVEWSKHLDNMMSLMQTLGNSAREGQLSSEMDLGTFDERGPVVVQIKRKLMARSIEPPVPPYVPNVEPWGRYRTFELDVKKNFKGKDLYENEHPTAVREMAIFHHNEKYVERTSRIRETVTRPKSSMLTWNKRFECSAFWGLMPLLEIDGKLAPGTKKSSDATATTTVVKSAGVDPTQPNSTGLSDAPPRRGTTMDHCNDAGDIGDVVSSIVSNSTLSLAGHPKGPNPEEVKEMAEMKSNRLHEAIVAVAMNGPTQHHNSSAEETVGKIIFKKGICTPSQTPRGSLGGGGGLPTPSSKEPTTPTAAVLSTPQRRGRGDVDGSTVAGTGVGGADSPFVSNTVASVGGIWHGACHARPCPRDP